MSAEDTSPSLSPSPSPSPSPSRSPSLSPSQSQSPSPSLSPSPDGFWRSGFSIVAPCSGGSRALRAALRAVASQPLTRPARGAAGAGPSMGGGGKEISMLRIYEDAIAVIAMLRPVVVEIGRHDGDLMRQLRRCAASMALNIAEGSYARAGNRRALYAVALGSTKETRACIEVAHAFGYVEAIDTQIEARLERIGGVLYRLAH